MERFETQDFESLKPPFSALLGISLFALLFFSIFTFLDNGRLYFVISLLSASVIAAYQFLYIKRTNDYYKMGGIVFYLVFWVGIFVFLRQEQFSILNFSLKLKSIMLISVLPLILVWLVMGDRDPVLGLENQNKRISSVNWKLAFFILVIVNFLIIEFQIWEIIELFVLFPLIGQTVLLSKMSEKDLPVLSLRISEEIFQRFSIPLSMGKSVGFIMGAYMFGLLNLRLWLIVVLLYFLAGFLWVVAYIIPPEMRSSEGRQSSDNSSEIFEKIADNFQQVRRDQKKPTEKEVDEVEELKEIVTSDPEGTISSVKVTPLSASAFNAGRKVREKVQKPVYTLNHILSTLTAEDFSVGYRVPSDGLTFPSLDGEWTPKAGLVIFPINLEKYDYRREGQTLLLTFHQPRESAGKIKMSFNEENSTIISKDLVKFGEISFNPRTLIVHTNDFENKIKPKLEKIGEEDDISYTGFQNLAQMQEILSKMADKWIEIRYKAKEVTVNFLAGLLGATDPVFIPKESQLSQSRELPKLNDGN